MRWVREIELGHITLPSRREMLTDIERKNRWQYKNYRNSARHTIEEEHVPYILELKRSLKTLAGSSAAS